MTSALLPSWTCFDGYDRIASGPLQAVAMAVKHAIERGAVGPVLVFDDTSGQQIDIDTRGTDEEVATRFANTGVMDTGEGTAQHGLSALPTEHSAGLSLPADQRRGRGRPKLGVVAREVTLLPRHWEWLAAQPGGTSVALRKLVEEARRVHGHKDKARKAQERAYSFMSALAGNLAGFEDAARALFADDRPRLDGLIASWPQDVRDHVIRLASSEGTQVSPSKPDERAAAK